MPRQIADIACPMLLYLWMRGIQKELQTLWNKCRPYALGCEGNVEFGYTGCLQIIAITIGGIT